MNHTASITTPITLAGEPPRVSRIKLPFSRKALMAVGAAVILGAVGAVVIAAPKSAESTDAAYIEADSSVAAPRVKGLVAEVLVQHNQAVHRGDPLIRIDPEEFDARVDTATADLLNAQATVQSAQAALTSLASEEDLAASSVRAAAAVIRAADAQSERATADRKRFEALVVLGDAARRDADTYKAAAISAESDAVRTRAQLDVSRNQADVVRAKRATLTAALAQAEAGVARAQAALNLAKQDQGHTVIRAAIDGVVGDRQVEPGDYVQPGSRLLTIVPLNALYVTANFKETQVSRMVAGQRATVEVDALPGVTLTGKVDSFAPGSGSQFSLLPFEPGTGNFTKIVQRVPVRIRFDADQADLQRLRPGLSTTVKVDLKSGT